MVYRLLLPASLCFAFLISSVVVHAQDGIILYPETDDIDFSIQDEYVGKAEDAGVKRMIAVMNSLASVTDKGARVATISAIKILDAVSYGDTETGKSKTLKEAFKARANEIQSKVMIGDKAQAERVINFLEALEDDDDVQKVHTNLDIDQNVLTELAAG